MTINDSLRAAVTKLSRVVSGEQPQAWAETERLMARTWKKDREWVIAHSRLEMTTAKRRAFDALVRRRLRHEPMAYLLGETEFCGRNFFVDKRALIPRPETEELVDLLASSFLSPQVCGIPPEAGLPASSCILDIGTGSGAIAIMLALAYPNATIIATDSSRPALALAKKNAARHGARIKFLQADLLSPSVLHLLASCFADVSVGIPISRRDKLPTSPLFVIANLPYLPLSDKKILAPDVVRYEPSSALFAKRDGMDLNLRLLTQLATFHQTDLRPILTLIEFDPPQANALAREARRLFPDAHIDTLRDSCGRNRFLQIHTFNAKH